MNVARDIQELSFAQTMQEETTTDVASDIEASNLEIAAQLLELSKLNSLDTLRECIFDVKNGIY